MKVKDIMTDNVIYAEVPGSSSDALEVMLKNKISGVPVVKRGTKELMGIVTRTDFARNPSEGQLALLMTRDITPTSLDEDISEVAKVLSKGKFRRMPVVEDGILVGILSVSDIVWKAIPKMNITDTVEKYLEETITAIWEDTPIKISYEIMRLSKERALPVLNSEGKLSGIISDTDILNVLEVTESTQKSELSGGTEGDKWGWDSKNVIYITKKEMELPAKDIKELMIKDVVTATKKTAVSECAKRMGKSRIEQIPVIDAEGEIIGIVRDVDLLFTLF